mmetsp:Transcript_6601/g.23533  ORF Transcript_6601/g.23533 Transcript_6601/m.23533 type:complete len:280 (+) Transcript_6601:281-1120(+)
MTGALPALNSANTQSRSCWLLSPWMASVGYDDMRNWRVKSSALRFVSVKMRILEPSMILARMDSSLARLSCSSTGSMICLMCLLAFRSRLPMVTWMKSLWKSLAIACTSFGHVALHMSVWRSGRIWPTILRNWGSKPMSSMRSASSSTRYVTRRRLILPDSRKSIRRPGVAITISQPRCRSRSWPLLGAPPNTHVCLMRDDEPNLEHSSWICCASSRVGASTSTIGPSPGRRNSCALMCTTAGSRNDSVFPEPVCAMPTTSRPERAIGQPCAWMGVGAL